MSVRKGPVPVVSLAIFAHVAAHPGATPRSVFDALNGSFSSIKSLMRNARAAGILHARKQEWCVLYYATAAARDAAAAFGPGGDTIRGRLMCALESMPGGATLDQIRCAVGASIVTHTITRAMGKGEMVAMMNRHRSVYFASAELMEASREAVVTRWGDLDLMYQARETARQVGRSEAGIAARQINRAARPPKSPTLKPPKPPTLKRVSEPTLRIYGNRKGWGRDDPAHITANTIVTICPSPPHVLRTNTHFQF